jgi:hypothetical protein
MNKCQWQIGDALLAEIPMSKDRSNNESLAKLEECRLELERNGFIVSTKTLRDYRSIAHKFPPDARYRASSFTTHIEAGTPVNLEAMLRIKGKDKVTPQEARALRPIVEERRLDRLYEESGKVRPKGNPNAVQQPIGGIVGQLNLMTETARQTENLDTIMRNLENVTRFLQENLVELDEETANIFIDAALEIVKKAHKFSNETQRLSKKNPPHLSIVGD